MMSEKNNIQREILPIPDPQHVGLTTYDARDPDTKYPLIVPDNPFFIYFAPHHVPVEWSDRYKGEFTQGWDKLRERPSLTRSSWASSASVIQERIRILENFKEGKHV